MWSYRHNKLMSMTPLEIYRRDLQRPDFEHDLAQERAVHCLQALYDRLVHEYGDARCGSVWRRCLRRWFKQAVGQPIQGLYCWGGVGRGKTYLMDNFYESLPFASKSRVHFHRFMRRIHIELKQQAGEKNPLDKIALRLSREARVICFDEFFVADIADAMILARLLQGLFERGVSLVATSNVAPDDLYRDGLQRERFLPAIDLLKAHTQVVKVESGVDYRLRTLEQATLYHTPLGAKSEAALQANFASLVIDATHIRADVKLDIEQRELVARYEADDIVWFEFGVLCEGPRSQNDYIELAREYHTVLVANVPPLGRDNDDQARRFIHLVDEFYDRHVKLVISAAKPPQRLYCGGRLQFEFERTASRLQEMQSREYLARPHRPE